MKITRSIRYESSSSAPLTGDEIVEAINAVAKELGPRHELRLHGDHGQTYKVEGYMTTDLEQKANEKLPPYTWAVHSQACQTAATANSGTTVTCRCIVASGATYRTA